MEEKTSKVCIKCGMEKPMSEFGLNRKMKDGHRNECKSSCTNYSKEYYRRKKKDKDALSNHLIKVYLNPELAKFQPKDLIAELRARGYSGELKYTQTIKI